MREKLGPDGSSPRCYNGSHGWWSGQSRWAAVIPDGGSIGDVVDGITGFPTNRRDAPWVQAQKLASVAQAIVDHPAAASSLTMAARG
jgi:hypothetical protein